MKKNTHPVAHDLEVTETNGNKILLRSCCESDSITLDRDRHNHPAWTGKQQQMATGGQVAKFAGRYGSIGQQARPQAG